MTDHKKWEHEMSTEFSGMMDEIRKEPMPEDSLQRSLEAAEAITMTKDAYVRGYINLGICLMVISPVWLIAFGINRQFDTGMILATMGTFAGLFMIVFPIMIWSMVKGRICAGKVLLDCGPHPVAKQFRLTAVLMFAGAVGAVIVSTDLFAILVAIFLAGFGLYWLLVSTGRLQICENGVFQYFGLLRWDQIKSYRWKGDTDTTLMVQTTSPFAFMGRGALPVANEQKDAVDVLLQKHVGLALLSQLMSNKEACLSQPMKRCKAGTLRKGLPTPLLSEVNKRRKCVTKTIGSDNIFCNYGAFR